MAYELAVPNMGGELIVPSAEILVCEGGHTDGCFNDEHQLYHPNSQCSELVEKAKTVVEGLVYLQFRNYTYNFIDVP